MNPHGGYVPAGVSRHHPSHPTGHGYEPERASWMQGQFQPKLGGGGGGYSAEAEQRRRTMSAGGAFNAQGSHESFMGLPHRSNGFVASPQDTIPGATTGRTTPVGNAPGGPKSRFTLDDHMSHRSPKAAATPGSSANSSASRPSSSMAIPAIPPFDRNRHEKHLLAQAQQTPSSDRRGAALLGGDSLPALAKPIGAPSLFSAGTGGHTSRNSQGDSPFGPAAHPLSSASTAAQRAG